MLLDTKYVRIFSKFGELLEEAKMTLNSGGKICCSYDYGSWCLYVRKNIEEISGEGLEECIIPGSPPRDKDY